MLIVLVSRLMYAVKPVNWTRGNNFPQFCSLRCIHGQKGSEERVSGFDYITFLYGATMSLVSLMSLKLD